MLRRQLLRHRYLSQDRVWLMGMIRFLVQGTIRIRIRVRVRVGVRVYESFNISISCRSICRRSICCGTTITATTVSLFNTILPKSAYNMAIFFWYEAKHHYQTKLLHCPTLSSDKAAKLCHAVKHTLSPCRQICPTTCISVYQSHQAKLKFQQVKNTLPVHAATILL